jgi:hypothetical protein
MKILLNIFSHIRPGLIGALVVLLAEAVSRKSISGPSVGTTRKENRK